MLRAEPRRPAVRGIMQVRIPRSRLAGEPADVVIRPRLSHVALMDFTARLRRSPRASG
jgi:predicted acylesterase/phospholipase RssA